MILVVLLVFLNVGFWKTLGFWLGVGELLGDLRNIGFVFEIIWFFGCFMLWAFDYQLDKGF